MAPATFCFEKPMVMLAERRGVGGVLAVSRPSTVKRTVCPALPPAMYDHDFSSASQQAAAGLPAHRLCLPFVKTVTFVPGPSNVRRNWVYPAPRHWKRVR